MNQVVAHQVTRFQETKSISVESKFSWEIKSFQDIKDSIVESSRIAIPDVDAEYWITVLPKVIDGVDVNDRNKSVFSFTLKMQSEAWKTNKYELEVFCSSPDRNFPSNVTNRKKVLQISSTPIDKQIMTTTEYIKANIVSSQLSKVNSYILDTKVTVRFLGSSAIRSKTYDPYAANRDILANVRGLYNDPTFSDFTFTVKNKEFKIHKNILGAASIVFMKLFTSEMEESRTNQCRIEHIEPEIFEKLLECVYKGKLPEDIGEYSRELYSAADYYGLDRLKELCRTEVHQRLNNLNAVDVFNWACRYSLDDLKTDSWEIVKR